MARFVYIKEIYEDSFLLFSTKGDGFRLRDYSEKGRGKAREIKRQSTNITAATILHMANSTGNFLIREENDNRTIDDFEYWHKKTIELNLKYLSSENRKEGALSKTQKIGVAAAIVTIIGGLIGIIANIGEILNYFTSPND